MSENPTPISLTSQARSALKGAAHPLRPVVLIGDQGLSPAVMQEIDRALTAHELIKVRAASQERDERVAMLEHVCQELGCAAVSHLGKILILYRPGKKGLYAAISGHAVPTITKRKPSEPHTPKKLAAQGKKSPPKRNTTRRSRQDQDETDRRPMAGKSAIKAFSSERRATASTRARTSASARRSPSKPAARGSVRSALSLRAGARKRST